MNDISIYWIDFEYLNHFIVDVFKALGMSEADALVCADVLIEADRRGIDSHGIGRLKPIYYDRIRDGILNPITKIDIIKDGLTTAVIDGNNGMGQVISKKAMELAIDKAKQYGLGMVVVRNSSHYGIAGYYATMATAKNMIGITGTNARPSIAPTFGVENILGTNPLTFGIPTNENFPFILDCATSTSQRGKIELYCRDGKEIPQGWVIDQDGTSRTDSCNILRDLIKGTAALTPLGGIGEEGAGYKGYGYATVVEILSAALQGGSFLKSLCGFENGVKVPYKLGHFFIAINIESFIDINEFKKIVGEILKTIRSSRKAPGCDKIYTAGEKEYEAYLFRKDKGIPLSKTIQEEILSIKNELNLVQYKFAFEE